jgi:hypothetical protein
VDSKVLALLTSALNQTRAGKLTWQEFGSESFRTRIGPGWLHLNRTYSENENEDGERWMFEEYSIQISDERGRVIAEEEMKATGGAEGKLVQDLFRVARNSALGGDEIIEKMLHALGQS